jgi:hypothetical protein
LSIVEMYSLHGDIQAFYQELTADAGHAAGAEGAGNLLRLNQLERAPRIPCSAA